ncbi:MAG: hypothetical protein OXC31_01210 [Spirochaetaceae bacterium]|nr:hypothetical protein [Spirochaetaceae bacterium]
MTTAPTRPLQAGETDGPPDVHRVRAAQQAFLRYHGQCFWYLRVDLKVTARDIPMIADGLRKNGGREGLLLAAQLCR